MALDGELAVFGDIVFQIGMVNALEQFFKALCLELCQHDHDALAGTDADIGLGQSGLIAGEQDSAVLNADIFKTQTADLVACDAFQAEQARNDKFNMIHRTSKKC